ncbi:MAG: Transcriptional regulator, LysR family, partial [uncultured Ramlibacter sp.]
AQRHPPAVEGVRGRGSPPQFLARRRRDAPHAAGRFHAGAQAAGACGPAPAGAVRQEDPPDRGGRADAAVQPRDHPEVRRGRGGDGAVQGRLGRPAERFGDQRRRLLLPAAAGRFRAAPRRRDDELRRLQPGGTAGPAGRQPDRPGRDGATAGRPGHRGRTLRAAPLRDRRAAHPSAGAHAPHHRAAHRTGAVRGARERLGHLELDGRGVRRAAAEPEHRDGDPQHRDHQAGGDGRHGRELPVGPHRQPRAAFGQPRHPGRAGLPADAQLVPGAPARQAPAAGGPGLQGLPAEGGRPADRPGAGRQDGRTNARHASEV